MRPCLPTVRTALALALLLCPMAVSLVPSVAMAEEAFVIKPVADKKLRALPAGALFWRVETFPTMALATAAEGSTSLSAEVAGKAWLFTLGAAGGSTPGGTKLAEVGPVPPIKAPEYLLHCDGRRYLGLGDCLDGHRP